MLQSCENIKVYEGNIALQTFFIFAKITYFAVRSILEKKRNLFSYGIYQKPFNLERFDMGFYFSKSVLFS